MKKILCKKPFGRALRLSIILITTFLLLNSAVYAQRDRAQFPSVFNNSYIEINIGYINYPFSASSLEPGYNFLSVKVPHIAPRIIMAGHQFNKYLSVQLSYMRPVLWVKYRYDSGAPGTEAASTVWMNVAGATLKPQLPLSDHFMIYGEAGLGIITRHGFTDGNGNFVIKNATYPYPLVGAGIKYSINDNWKLMLSALWSPEKKSVKQPATSYISAGFSYMMHSLTPGKLEEKNKPGYFFPKQILHIGFASNAPGYSVNRFFSNDKFPVFWLGDAFVSKGISVDYTRNVFHGKKIFSLDWGTSMGLWQGKLNGELFFTASLFPLFRWTVVRIKPLDLYLLYSLAGPTFISAKTLDGQELGGYFTFKDFMGAGWFAGKERNISVELRISHFSNGNLYPRNAGVCVPLSLNVGYVF